jgi:hypothetical protein
LQSCYIPAEYLAPEESSAEIVCPYVGIDLTNNAMEDPEFKASDPGICPKENPNI